MPKTTLTPDEQAASYEAALEQSNAQIAALNERVKELAGFQKEAVDGRDAVAKLQAQLDGSNAALEQAQRAAAAASAGAKDAERSSSADAELVAAAKNLAAAIKKLS